MSVLAVETGQGPAHAHLHPPKGEPAGTLLLTHGAGGGIGAVDLAAIATALPQEGWQVVLVEMPWRVAGKKVAPAPKRLDEAWREIVPGLRELDVLAGRLAMGGRSAGARVACRLAGELDAHGVLCLSFPLVPPGKGEDKSRIGELVMPLQAGLPVHVVQGAKDPFGRPEAVRAALDASGVAGDVLVDEAPGTHSFTKAGVTAVVDAVRARLTATPPPLPEV